MSTTSVVPEFVRRTSLIELDARSRAEMLIDAGTGRELVGPFERIESPWLPEQGIAPQSDDGCVVIKGQIGGKPAVVVALEGGFQAGSMGEVSGAKMTPRATSHCVKKRVGRRHPSRVPRIPSTSVLRQRGVCGKRLVRARPPE